jgi:hypothetical protein
MDQITQLGENLSPAAPKVAHSSNLKIWGGLFALVLVVAVGGSYFMGSTTLYKGRTYSSCSSIHSEGVCNAHSLGCYWIPNDDPDDEYGGGCAAIQKWSCEDWTACDSEGNQTRICAQNQRSTQSQEKPAETQTCTYTPPACDTLDVGACGGRTDCVFGENAADTEGPHICQNKPLPPAITYFRAVPPTVTSGGFTNLEWNSPTATGCVASGGTGNSGDRANEDSYSMTGLTATTTFTLTCTGLGGNNTATVTVTVNPVTATIDSIGGEIVADIVIPTGETETGTTTVETTTGTGTTTTEVANETGTTTVETAVETETQTATTTQTVTQTELERLQASNLATQRSLEQQISNSQYQINLLSAQLSEARRSNNDSEIAALTAQMSALTTQISRQQTATTTPVAAGTSSQTTITGSSTPVASPNTELVTISAIPPQTSTGADKSKKSAKTSTSKIVSANTLAESATAPGITVDQAVKGTANSGTISGYGTQGSKTANATAGTKAGATQMRGAYVQGTVIRGKTGPEMLLYFGVLPIVWGLRRIRRK